MIDLQTEKIVTLTEAAKMLPGRPAVSTLWRWRTRGVHGIRLETRKLGHSRVTSMEAIERFSEAVTAAADGKTATIAAPVTARRQRELDRVDRELSKAGI